MEKGKHSKGCHGMGWPTPSWRGGTWEEKRDSSRGRSASSPRGSPRPGVVNRWCKELVVPGAGLTNHMHVTTCRHACQQRVLCHPKRCFGKLVVHAAGNRLTDAECPSTACVSNPIPRISQPKARMQRWKRLMPQAMVEAMIWCQYVLGSCNCNRLKACQVACKFSMHMPLGFIKSAAWPSG